MKKKDLRSGYWGKRPLEACCSFAILLFISPLLILIAIGIELVSPGPVLFTRLRMGKGRRAFNIYKFRTLEVGASIEGEVIPLNNLHPKVIPVIGKFLRDTCLDELPQLWNVFKGDMGFVGGRPDDWAIALMQIENNPDYAECIDRFLPGLTGPEQLDPDRVKTTDPEVRKRGVGLSLGYGINQNFLGDVGFVWQTFCYMLKPLWALTSSLATKLTPTLAFRRTSLTSTEEEA